VSYETRLEVFAESLMSPFSFPIKYRGDAHAPLCNLPSRPTGSGEGGLQFARGSSGRCLEGDKRLMLVSNGNPPKANSSSSRA
jgi:hypothetical protein